MSIDWFQEKRIGQAVCFPVPYWAFYDTCTKPFLVPWAKSTWLHFEHVKIIYDWSIFWIGSLMSSKHRSMEDPPKSPAKQAQCAAGRTSTSTFKKLDIPDAPCMEYLPAFGSFLGSIWLHVGKYSMHGASGYGS